MRAHHTDPYVPLIAGNQPGTERRGATVSVTTNRLIAASGLCAAAAGAIFIGVQINHPPADVQHVLSGDLVVRETAKAVMAVLALAGLTGLYARNHRRLGVVGHVGYALVSIGYLAMFAVQCIVGYVLPTVARTSPEYVQDVLDAAMGKPPAGDIGHMNELLLVAGLGYAFGGLLFGIALFRAGIVSRWASALFAYGTVSALTLAALPQSFSRPFAVPTGVALVGLGISLWREQRGAVEPVGDPAAVRLAVPAGP
jgi:hypothetical protein